MEAAGFSSSVMKDPEKILKVIEKYQNLKGTEKEAVEQRKICTKAKESMIKNLTKNNLANSFALQQSLASGEDMKKAQEAAAAADDQMQLIGANTATLRVIYLQSVTSMAMSANSIAMTYLNTMCK